MTLMRLYASSKLASSSSHPAYTDNTRDSLAGVILLRYPKGMTIWHSGRESSLLDAIIDGRKTIEGRLNKGKFAEYRVGDEIRLRRDVRDMNGVLHDGEPDQARVRIVAIRQYDSFLSMVSEEGYGRVIPAAVNAQGAAAEYNKFYSAEDQAHYGVLAIQVEFLLDWDEVYRSGHDFGVLHENIINRIANFVVDSEDRTALDVGCGVGNLVRQLGARLFDVTGVDPSSEAIELARLRDVSNVYIHGTINDVDGEFDLITCKHVIAFIPDLMQFMNQVADHLAPSGVFAVVAPTLDRIINGKPGIAIDRQVLVGALESRFSIADQVELPSGLLLICRKKRV